MHDSGSTAPPARQASNDDLAGIGGDLPLTAAIRSIADPLARAKVIAGLAAAAWFAIQLAR